MAFVPKRYIDSQSVNKELKRIASGHKAAYVAPIATADAVDPATTMAMTNIEKAKINALIAALIAGGVMAAS